MQKTQIQIAAFVLNFAQQLLNARRFLIGQSAASDRIRDLFNARIETFFPRWKRRFKSGKRAVAIHIVSRLTQNDENQSIERIAFVDGARAEFFDQNGVDAVNCLFGWDIGRGFDLRHEGSLNCTGNAKRERVHHSAAEGASI